MNITGRQLGFVLGPLFFITLLLTVSETLIAPGAYKVLAVAAWMVTWWISEAAPVAVTALLPLIIFPALGVMTISASTAPYANSSVFLFMGGFMIALGLEKYKLHERFALNLIRFTGTSGNGIILGFTLATAIISMWISNTATALMMLPMATSVITLLRRKDSDEGTTISKGEHYFALGLMLSIGYAASIGGMATKIGTPPNVVLDGFIKQFYQREIPFGQWLLIGLPVSILITASTYFIITRILFPNRLPTIPGSSTLIRDRLHALGKIQHEEKMVLIIFCITSFLWIFQGLLNILAGSEFLNDTNIAMFGGLLMFTVPVKFSESKFLLTWEDTKRLPWGILILFGGGICLAKGMEVTNIIKSIGDFISNQRHLPFWALVLILVVVSVVLTEFMSNVALVTIFVPVVFAIAEGLHLNPVLLALPVTLAASCAFMFPISTPPNAIVFASGHIKMKDMMQAGLLLNLASILIIWLLTLLFQDHLSL